MLVTMPTVTTSDIVLRQACNFLLLPVAHQLNFVLIVSLGWAAYLSWAGGQTGKKERDT